jgi:soluble lytic murein transglycosylase-like protein
MNLRRSERQRTWRPGPEYRVICPCQAHARRGSLIRRTVRIASRSAALLVSIPLAFAALDLPIAAMNLNVAALRKAAPPEEALEPPLPVTEELEATDQPKLEANAIPIFATPSIRDQFLSPGTQTLELDVFREEYFRKHIPFGAIIHREARKNGLAPELVAAMVHTESDFRPQLVSHKSAQGLMQIVPGTARLLGIKNPFDPEENIAAGTKYYRYLLNRFKDESLALAAYNAGPGNVERFGGIPPFAETKSYVTKVNRRTHRYRQRVHTNYLSTIAPVIAGN